MNGNEPFDEILFHHTAGLPVGERYVRLYALLDRLCKQLTADAETDFSNLFSRLHYLCRKRGVTSTAIEVFRLRGKQARQGTLPAELTEDDYRYDLKALCEWVSAQTSVPVPEKLQRCLPRRWRALPESTYHSEVRKRMRVAVTHWDESYIYAYDEAHPADAPFPVICPEAFGSLRGMLYAGAQLNLLSVRSDEAGVLCPEIVVLEPDYLIDISALAACYTNYGHSPLQYLVNKLTPRETSHYTLLGNAANQFLDDCVNERPDAPATFEGSIQKAFRTNVMEYCTCTDIDAAYFARAAKQFDNIHHTVEQSFPTPDCHIDKNSAVLEPSFLCECLGLQGRMDFLQSDGHLIELKSGKAEEWGSQLRSKESHALQMALYKEVLYYNLDIPREEIHSFLFYSVYPKLFLERSSKAQIQHAIDLRNRIVGNELLIKRGQTAEVLARLTPENLNERGDTSKLWTLWQRPALERRLAPLRLMQGVEAAYFRSFLTFVAKEQFLAKTGDAQPDSSRGFSDLWNADLATKQAAGNILTDLHIIRTDDNEGIELIALAVPDYDESFLPNFRPGDIVLLYERTSADDNATRHQVFRGSIEHIADGEMTIRLRHKQRNAQVFSAESAYALEHDFMDSSFNNLYQGLYTFLTAPEARRSLILGQRAPRTNPERTLTRHYLNEQIDRIVLQAKQADDYFLLIGPPGTGKTSIALRSMVEEFHADPQCNILLMSYTNRAVDEICEMLESIPDTPEYVRIGSHLSCDERFRPRLLQEVIAPCANRAAIRRVIDGVRIVVGTTASVMGKTDLFKLKRFHVAIVDEASQILEPQIVGILSAHDADGRCAIGKFILVGDHKQLPAVVLQTEKDSRVDDPSLLAIGLSDRRNSFFERLYRLQQKQPVAGIVAMLDHQGRMHPAVSDFANRRFYGGKLDIVPVKHQTAELEFVDCPASEADPLAYFVAHTRTGFFPSHQPPAADSNKINREEAHITASLVRTIHELCLRNGLPFRAKERIGIIVPFRNQIALVNQALRNLNIPETDDITVDTVERYQGSQRDIIIYSTTISRPYQLDMLSVPIADGPLVVDRKLNVAITRAKKQFFLTGNASLLARNDIYRDFIRTLTPYTAKTTAPTGR